MNQLHESATFVQAVKQVAMVGKVEGDLFA
jgi:hypothetical protein